MAVFTRIVSLQIPEEIFCENSASRSPEFDIIIHADGDMPFAQVILRKGVYEYILRDDAVGLSGDGEYCIHAPAGLLDAGEWSVQAEGCRRGDIENSIGDDWIKEFGTFNVVCKPADIPEQNAEAASPAVEVSQSPEQASTQARSGGMKLYFGIHKHMHQPFYNATDTEYWDGEKDEIFGSRGGPYTHFVARAVEQYVMGGLPHAGLSTSWSGTLIEQLNRCRELGRCGGTFSNWNRSLANIAPEKTSLGNPRLDFTAFGYYHPLMALIPSRDIVRQIRWHRKCIQDAFGVEASRVLFPPETAFHVRMIPALLEAGVEAVIYDSIHRFRSCKDYPYAGVEEGMLPPNPAEQENEPVSDWLQLHNVWAGSKISPSLLRPEYVKYEDVDGTVSKIIAVPAERYLGNEDARGGFGALQYPDVLGQVYDQIASSGSYDPEHPPFFLLHSDGDNYGGGAESYYSHNTGQLVEWLKGDPRFELITVKDYLQMFPPDPQKAVHIEPGAWSGADNGDPQFMKWFSRYNEAYSPDLNSWAVLTALQNVVHSIEDAHPNFSALDRLQELMLTAETSCYWYWTGQEIWDGQVTNAANYAFGMAQNEVDSILSSHADKTGPTIFAPWVTPENPGGQAWGQGCLVEADKDGVVHTFVYDICGLSRVNLCLRTANGEKTLSMKDNGHYPCQTGAAATAHYYTASLPQGAGDVRYYIEAEDNSGNISRSSLERIFLA